MHARIHNCDTATCRVMTHYTEQVGHFATLEVTVGESSVTLFFQSKDEIIDLANKILTATAV